MSTEPLATIRGIPHLPTITEVNVRTGPSTTEKLIFRIPVGTSGLNVLNVLPDSKQNQMNGKTYQWFQLRFHGGAVGWVRDDLLDLEGDLRQWGYPVLRERTWAFSLIRDANQPEESEEMDKDAEKDPMTISPPEDLVPAMQDIERVRKASFAITIAFEGGYASYNNRDRAIVSYGIIQFSLAAGSLSTVVDLYLENSQSDTAGKLRRYLPRIHGRDPGLRFDGQFRELLTAAAEDQAMRDAQHEVMRRGFWEPVVRGYIEPRQLKMPLTWALLFDMGVNFGTNHGFVRLAERELGVPERSRPGENGITEEQLTARVALLRKMSHDRQAARDNLPGLRVRGNFWVDLVKMDDWGLQGGPDGTLNVNGRRVDVRNPD